MEYFQIADMFGRRRRPVLEFFYQVGGVEPGGWADRRVISAVRRISIGVKNTGRAIARFPAIRVESRSIVGYAGLDSVTVTLPATFADPGWIVFAGGADHVIHPGTSHRIGDVKQSAARPPNQRPELYNIFVVEPSTVRVEMFADNMESTTQVVVIPGDKAEF